MPDRDICPSCREPVDPWESSCRYCGAEVTDSPARKRRRRWPYVVLGLVIGLWVVL